MSESLFDAYGARKYVAPLERAAFVRAAVLADVELAAFCLTLAITGARISEVLALRTSAVDIGDSCIVFRTLKQRSKVRFRSVPAPSLLLNLLAAVSGDRNSRSLWSFHRTHAWHAVKGIMRQAGIGEAQCKPKALRHGFAVEAVLNGVPLNILQRWMGHARMETTAIYASVLGEEERVLARRSWKILDDLPPIDIKISKSSLKVPKIE